MSVQNPELLFLQALATAIYVGGSESYGLFSRCKKKKKSSSPECDNKLFVVLSSRKSGVTTQLKMIENTANVLMIDAMEDIINTQRSDEREMLKELANTNSNAFCVKMFPLVSKYLDECRKAYKNRPIILFTSEPELVEYLDVPLTHVACLLPSMSFYQKLISDFSEEDLKLLSETRENLIKLPYGKFMFSSFDGLMGVLERFLNHK
jgi:hypothetical protein